MISIYDIIQFFKKLEDNGKDSDFKLSDDHKEILDRTTGEYICSIETYAKYLRQKLHCDFDRLYHDHASLTTIYVCNECGTVIFSGDDERYDPNLKCPICAKYNHHDYWTKEEIDADEKKQKTIQFYKDWMKEQKEAYKRRQARGGLYDWQVFKKDKYCKNHSYHLEMTNYKGYTKWGNSVYLEFSIGTKMDDGIGYVVKRHYKIPLSPYAFYIRFIFPHTKQGKRLKD